MTQTTGLDPASTGKSKGNTEEGQKTDSECIRTYIHPACSPKIAGASGPLHPSHHSAAAPSGTDEWMQDREGWKMLLCGICGIRFGGEKADGGRRRSREDGEEEEMSGAIELAAANAAAHWPHAQILLFWALVCALSFEFCVLRFAFCVLYFGLPLVFFPSFLFSSLFFWDGGG